MMKSKQRGGTFLGVILGVMVGLAVALAVAIYVAKVPIPFVNKNTSRTNGQDAAEAQRNRDWDPNAPLRSRNGAKPAAPAVSGAVAPATAPAPAPEPAPVPAPAEVARPTQRHDPTPASAVAKPSIDSRTAAASAARTGNKPAADSTATAAKPAADNTTRPAQRPPSSDPLGDLANARAGNVDPFTYFVQAGAFRNMADADAQRARLSLMGVETRITEREQAGRTVYRVRVGPFQNKDAADRVKARLDGNGFDSALVRVQR